MKGDPSDPARYYARRVRELHEVSEPDAQVEELEEIARSRGVEILEIDGLPEWGGYVDHPHRQMILVRKGAPAHVRAHELAEFLFRDNARHGVDLDCPGFRLGDPHRAANRFADDLCPRGWRGRL